MKYKFLILYLLLSIRVIGQSAGSYDTTFNNVGYLTTLFDTNACEGRKVLIQNDNKIIIVGNVFIDTLTYFAAMRFNPNGITDSTYGINGKTKILFDSNGGVARSAAIQDDQKIIIVGYASNNFAVIRIKLNGEIDSTFGTYGKVLIPVGPYGGVATAVAIQPDGKIIVAGYSSTIESNYDYALTRLNENGSIDSTFGLNGLNTANLGYAKSRDCISAISLQTDGKIVVSGASSDGGDYLSIARFKSNGILDNGLSDDNFNYCGYVVNHDVSLAAGSGSYDLYGLTIQSNHKIIIAGYSIFNCWEYGCSWAITLVRYNQNRLLDISFGTNGIAKSNVSEYYSNRAHCLTMQPDAKIIAAGCINSNFAINRYDYFGAIDTTFGNDGTAIMPLGLGEAYSVTMQNDGKIIATGYTNIISKREIAVARYNCGPFVPPDTLFPNDINFMIFPNPATNILYIGIKDNNASQNNILSIYDIQGQLILNQTICEEISEFDIRNFANGIYIIKVSNNTNTIIKKFVKS